MATIGQDLKYGLRTLARSPGFTAAAVITLALGIGGNVAVFSLLDTVLLRPLPYRQPDRLFMLLPIEARSGRAMVATSYPNFQDWQQQSHAFEAMAAFDEDSLNLTGTPEPARLRALSMTPGLFALLGVRPVLGREAEKGDDRHVAVLSYELWRSRLGGKPDILGKAVQLDGEPYTVIGVLPPRFHFPPRRWEGAAEIFVPAISNPDRRWNYLRVVGRLAPNTTERQAQTEMKGIAARLAQAYPKGNYATGIALDALDNFTVSDVRETLWVLLGAVAFVLLISCANVSNLLLSRGAAREREIAIRSMVGASRMRIVRQLLTEGLLLAGVGGAVGVMAAHGALPVMAFAVPEHTALSARVHDVGIHLDSAVLAFSAILSVLSVLLFGLLPAWRASRPLGSSAAGLRARAISGSLIALEVAMSYVLLTAAGLMMKSLVRLLQTDVGFQTDRLLTMDIDLSGPKYSSAAQQAAFFRQVLQRLASLPSVRSAAAVTDLPLTRSSTWNGFEIPGRQGKQGVAAYHSASPGYFSAMGIPLLSGRELRDSDSAASPLVGIINRSMARRYWPGQNPVGASIVAQRIFTVSTPSGKHFEFKSQQLEVVGVVGDVRQLGLDAPPGPELFMPYSQWPAGEMSLVLRTESEPPLLVAAAKKEIWRTDPDQPVTEIKSMDELVSAEAAGRRFVLQLIGAFASIAVVLAVIGTYGVASYWVRKRSHEIAVRVAVGGMAQEIVWMLVRQNSKWLLAGMAAGVGGAFATTRLLARYLYGVASTDPMVLFAAAILLAVAAVAAVYVPARRIAAVDPMAALRCT